MRRNPFPDLENFAFETMGLRIDGHEVDHRSSYSLSRYGFRISEREHGGSCGGERSA